MEIAFYTEDLRILCESEHIACDEFGVGIALQLKKRLADIRAASNFFDLVAGKPHVIDESEELISIEIAINYHILLLANHVVNPKLGNGKIDWSKVSRVKVLDIREG